MKTYEELFEQFMKDDIDPVRMYVAIAVRDRFKNLIGENYEFLCDLVYKMRANYHCIIDITVDKCVELYHKLGSVKEITEDMLVSDNED